MPILEEGALLDAPGAESDCGATTWPGERARHRQGVPSPGNSALSSIFGSFGIFWQFWHFLQFLPVLDIPRPSRATVAVRYVPLHLLLSSVDSTGRRLWRDVSMLVYGAGDLPVRGLPARA